MEFVQFHPTGMVWPPGVRGLLVTEAVRGEGGILRNKDGKRFMWDYLPDDRRHEYAENDEEARTWVEAQSVSRQTDARRPPELSTRDNVARAIYTEVREGRGSPHGGVFLDISYLPAEHVRRKLPSMYEQFKELADVDITAGPMEVGPTTHYVMGGIRVDAETGATTVPGLFAAGEVAGGMHGANRLGGNSLSDLLVFGQRTGAGAPPPGRRSVRDDPYVDPVQVRTARGGPGGAARPDGWRRIRTGSARSSRRRCSRSSGSSGRRPISRPAIAAIAEIRKRAADLCATGRSRLQPRLEPRVRAPESHRHLRGDRPQRADPRGEPRRPQPARLPLDRDAAGPRRTSSVRRDERGPRGGEPRRIPPMPDDLRVLAEAGGGALMPNLLMRVFRGSPKEAGSFAEFEVPVEEGMVVLDALHWIQAHAAPGPRRPLELQGREVRLVQRRGQRPAEPHLQDAPLGLRPGRADHGRADAGLPAHPRPRDRRVVELRGQQVDPALQPPADVPVEDWRWQQEDIERVQEFRKCIECFLCQDVCHVLRNHEMERPFMGPRFLVRAAGLEMHPIDQADRTGYLKDDGGIGFCNITKCCTEVCPGAHQDHRQRDHPAQGTRRGRVLRPDPDGLAQDPRGRRSTPAVPRRRTPPTPLVGARRSRPIRRPTSGEATV